jgi:hypothetical protein
MPLPSSTHHMKLLLTTVHRQTERVLRPGLSLTLLGCASTSHLISLARGALA